MGNSLLNRCRVGVRLGLLVGLAVVGASAQANDGADYGDASGCRKLPPHNALRAVLSEVTALSKTGVLGGIRTDKWATLVDRDGNVCAVAFSGGDRGDQWPASRVISAQKASTANAFSVPAFAIATGNLYQGVQPGQALFGVPLALPVDPAVVYAGPAARYGQPNDPMVGKKVGGMATVGGGLALYNAAGQLVGGLGVSGDSPCGDHIVAWVMRDRLQLDYVPRGLLTPTDNLIHDTVADPVTGHIVSASGFGHPTCFDEVAHQVVNNLPTTYPTGR